MMSESTSYDVSPITDNEKQERQLCVLVMNSESDLVGVTPMSMAENNPTLEQALYMRYLSFWIQSSKPKTWS